MGQIDLNGFFQDFLDKKSIFADKQVLQSGYLPNEVIHRDSQIKQIANILAPSLRLEKPSNLFIYGKTGTGKTLTAKHVAQNLSQSAKERSIPLEIIYLNCKLKKIADTEYRLMAHLAREFGKAIPITGLPTDEVYRSFFDAVEKSKRIVFLILDEIDGLVKKTGDEVLYNLTRVNEELGSSKIAIIGISNDISFLDYIDPRVKSSLSEESLIFPPYNAIQLQDILRLRAGKAFHNGSLEQGVIEKCAAYSAQEHGDARRAIELLRVAAEIAERGGSSQTMLRHIDEAEDKIEKDRFLDIIANQPKQGQAVLAAIFEISHKRKGIIFTGEVYELYKDICAKTNIRPLTQRRVSDVVAELDSVGIIHTKVISKGRYGRTREISLTMPISIVNQAKNMLEEELAIRAQ